MNKPWVIGITGASGAVYGVRLCRFLLSRGEQLHIVITDAGWRVLKEELGWDASRRQESLHQHLGGYEGSYEYVPNQDVGAKTASGSFLTQGMVVVPCSMGTLSGIANGASDNLLERTADVMLKEGRKLILVPRETPLHAIHLENMLKLSRLGVRMIPAMPAFYQGPQTVDDLIDFVVGKIVDNMEIEHQLYKRWGMQP
ncbi:MULTISPECIES: flavin prenyltransferase UbiX [unclassified Paenibacillus]|uniref:UbiX family flavin prenyltransferase n=1 Tax=unclassified Paenibacillus TaxID=185978 RepID=UPI001AE24BD1|nr:MULTISPECIES: flavin prenyltransferase UbiX [unclassified Paenibacillus]MBP1155261.1 4-hydroxy-3-polyprenylbenzoate decarboxylase [Paenibacillus sp. PvP091]MBP1169355.1 4-hydroxy-3-polyprenylbenzoate decarboxylase [Paenibacillus sp. PvR098]MBP2440383.1 4-hydroxy-3-polyprenylbenzoate decarboxylase [Paenibacillus sp. PvP052]